MAKKTSSTKNEIIQDFQAMKAFETSACSLYTRIAESPDIQATHIKTAFGFLAADEQHHADLVDEIIDIVADAL